MSIAIDQATLRSLVHYDPATGILTWLRRAEVDGHVRRWNSRYAGQPITHTNKHGYIAMGLKFHGKKYRLEVHRLAWLYVYGVLPELEVDHINRIKTDNKIKNLRLATDVQTAHNVGLTSRNKSGVKGVNWHKASQKWIARIAFQGKQIYLGTYDDLGEALDAYRSASLRYAENFSIHAMAA